MAGILLFVCFAAFSAGRTMADILWGQSGFGQQGGMSPPPFSDRHRIGFNLQVVIPRDNAMQCSRPGSSRMFEQIFWDVCPRSARTCLGRGGYR